jgi:hypothetical protein
MHKLLFRVLSAIDATFGTCPICMRRALASALAAWGAWTIGWLLWPDPRLLLLLGLAAAGAACLWTLHVATFAARPMRAARRRRQLELAISGKTTVFERSQTERQVDRRAALRLLLKAVSVAVSVSMPLWPLASRAEEHTCGDGSRCDPGYKCCWNSKSEAWFCCYASHVCCVDGQRSYCRNPDAGEYC